LAIRTEIGFGSPRAGTFAAHGEPLGADNVRKTKEVLNWPTEPAFFVPDDILSWWRDLGAKGASEQAAWQKDYDAWKAADPALAAQYERAAAGTLPERINWPAFTPENGAVATRDAGGVVLNAIAADVPELIGGSADLDPSTKTYLKGLGDFQPGDYAGRNLHFGVREHAMGAIANGLSLHGGVLPFTATFFNFVDYMKPAVRLAALSGSKAIFVFTHDSFDVGEDGPTHQPIEQLAGLRATPNLIVLRPADAVETREAWRFAVGHEGPSSIVLTRQKVPFLGERAVPIERGAYVLHGDPEKLPELVLIATGSEVSLALDAAKLLEAGGTNVRVVSMPSMELFAAQEPGYRDAIIPPQAARVSIEAGATFGWHRWVGERGVTLGVDHYGASAPAGDIAREFGFTAENVAAVASRLLVAS
jgi:transketolase